MSADCTVCHGFRYSFGGIPMAQYLCDLMVWELALNNHPVTGIWELGTWKGGFSWFLDAQARARGIEFHTFDVQAPDVVPPGFEKSDIFRDAPLIGGRLHGAGPVALFCDGGNKPRELATFPLFCHPDSVILVHDWGTETLPADVPDFLVEQHGEYCDEIGSITRVFTVKP